MVVKTQPLLSDKPDRRPIVAAMVASLLVLVFGLTYRMLLGRMETPGPSVVISSEALQGFPMEIGDWTGEDMPMDEQLVRVTRTDAHINRRYSRGDDLKSVSVFVGCGVGPFLAKRPESCYPQAGWTLVDQHSAELPLEDGRRLLCSVFQFSRAKLGIKRITVLHYYMVRGQYCDHVSPLQKRVWRIQGMTDLLGRVLISSNGIGTVEMQTELVTAFALESASPLARLFQDIAETLEPLAPDTPPEGRK